jgi:hypothetical protein
LLLRLFFSGLLSLVFHTVIPMVCALTSRAHVSELLRAGLMLGNAGCQMVSMLAGRCRLVCLLSHIGPVILPAGEKTNAAAVFHFLTTQRPILIY